MSSEEIRTVFLMSHNISELDHHPHDAPPIRKIKLFRIVDPKGDYRYNLQLNGTGLWTVQHFNFSQHTHGSTYESCTHLKSREEAVDWCAQHWHQYYSIKS